MVERSSVTRKPLFSRQRQKDGSRRRRTSLLSRLGIAQRIYLAFGMMVVLAGALCVAGYFGVQVVSRVFSDYRAVAGQSVAISQIVQQVDGLRMTDLRYRVTRTEGAAKAFVTISAALTLNKPESLAVFAGDPAAEASIAEIQKQVAAYIAAFNEMAALDKSVAAGIVKAAEIVAATETIVGEMDPTQSSRSISDVKTALTAMSAAARTYADGSDDAAYKTMLEQHGIAKQKLTAVGKSLPSLTGKAAAAVALLDEYAVVAAQWNKEATTLKAVESNKLDRTGFKIQQTLTTMQNAMSARQGDLGASGDANATSTQMILAAAGAAAVLIAVLFAVVISRWLGRTLKGMTDNMRRLADGDYGIDLRVGEQRHELGKMAEALDVFRTNGIAVREMDEQRNREAEDEEQRNRRRAAVQLEVERVVAAALDGDFTARIDEHGVDSDLAGFVVSLNRVMETVETGIGETSTVLAAFAEADLTRRMQGNYRGAFAVLKDDLNRAAETFGAVVSELQQTSRSLKNATTELLAGANDLSERTTKQAATIEETSAAVEQMASNVATNAANAEQASAKSQSASRMANEGGEAMAQATAAMERITDSSSKISNIIGLIDDIAFQTNLLALNASVEAARAGEAGKGFAVVAVEVRRLAQSAAKASSEVKALIQQSASQVAGGSRLVETAASKLASILEAVRENSALMEGISRASREQAVAIEEVNASVRQLDEMTQHNAALVEETNASIEQTEAQAGELDRIVEVFTLRADSTPEQPVRYRTRGNAALAVAAE